MDDCEILTMAVEMEANSIDHGLDVPTLVGLIQHLDGIGLEGRPLELGMIAIMVYVKQCNEKRSEGLYLIH